MTRRLTLMREINLYDAANRPSDVRVYDGQGRFVRTIPVTTLLRRSWRRLKRGSDVLRNYPQ